MTQEELLYFIRHILNTTQSAKYSHVMNQLADILKMQNADPSLQALVRQASLCHSDLNSILSAKKNTTHPELTPEDIQIAERRRAARLAREQQLRYNGRC